MRPIATLALACAAAALPAAATIDLDLVRLRQAPDAPRIAAALQAAMPEAARERLAAIRMVTGWEPQRDLQRVVVTIPDQGHPSARLVGLPAKRIAEVLALRGGGVPAAGGTGYPLPGRPGAVFVAVAADQAVVGRAEDLAAVPAPAPLAAPVAAIRAEFAPGPHPRLPAMAQVRSAELRGDGAGHWQGALQAVDEPAAVELERRAGVLRRMVATGAEGGLERMQEAQQALSATTVSRQGSRLDLVAAIPADLRGRLIDRALERLAARSGRPQ